jgi:hypothetical protein
MIKPVEIDQRMADRLVKFIQEMYGLDRWDIRVAVVKSVTLEGAHGDCQFESESRTAFIRLREIQDSVEHFVDTVVHELTHVVLWWADYDSDASDEMKLRCTVLEQSLRDLTKPAVRYVMSQLQNIFDEDIFEK